MGISISSPRALRYLRDVARDVLEIVREIQASRIFENPVFSQMAAERNSYRRPQGGQAPTAGRQGRDRQGGRDRQEEGRDDSNADDEIWIEDEAVGHQATWARDASQENIQDTSSRQSVAAGTGRRTNTGTYESEDATRRRLYQTSERRTAVLEMKRVDKRVSESGTKSADEGGISMVGEAINGKDNLQSLEDHSAFQLVSIPTDEDIGLAKQNVQYVEGLFHFAVTGISGAGKSSLINAFRGLRNKDQGAAPAGVVETTMDIARFPDPNPQNPFIWYDVPGSGTLSTPDWQYFNAQGLYVFDCIIILFDSRFTMSDLAILVNCRRLNIPTYIVRSKSDSHIRNIMKDSGYNSDDDESRSHRIALYSSAREQYIAETRATVRHNLQDANLPDQRVYIVAHSTMVAAVREHKLSEKTIDELELMRDLFKEAQSRRCAGSRSPTREL